MGSNPTGGPFRINVMENCKHKFVFLRTSRSTDDSGAYNTKFTRVDTFFCEHCLEYKEVKKEEWSRDTPAWYREK